jgi:DNA-binding transcriptional regulator YiaG
MTVTSFQWSADSTSGAGAMLAKKLHYLKLVGPLLAPGGTSSEQALPLAPFEQMVELVEHTTAGTAVVNVAGAEAAIAELRRLSGLTWDQLARLFRVSRRSLHFWASGKPMTPSNEEHLQRLLLVVRGMDRGSADANRAALVSTHEDGTIPFDLLVEGQYERAKTVLGAGVAERVNASKPSRELLTNRAPQPPEELVDALQDRIHPASGRLLRARAVRVPRRP